MALLEVVRHRFGAAVDPDSDAGRILGALTPRPPFDDAALSGQADVAPLTFTPTGSGLSVRAAQSADAVVLSLPAGPLEFTIVPPGAAGSGWAVRVDLLALTVPLPFLRGARLVGDDALEAVGGPVALRLPNLQLVIDGDAAGAATARLAPAEAGGGGLDVTMTPSFALVGPGTALGFGFERANLKLDGPGEPEVVAPDAQVFVAPPGVSALNLRGGVRDLRIGLGTVGGVSGDFALELAASAARPRFLHELACRLRLQQSAVTRLEIAGRIDLQRAVESRLGGPLGDPPAAAAAQFVLGLALDQGWRTSLALTGAGGQGYLWRTARSAPDGAEPRRDTLGAYAVFAPLLAPNLPRAGSSGYVDLALGAGAAGALVTAGLVRTLSVTVFGGELVVREAPGAPPEGFLFFDVETALHVTAQVGGATLLATRRPLKVRHQAIGLRLDFGADGNSPQVRPVFDPARGFSLDLSDPGMFEVPGPLGDILQLQGTRMARQNPLCLDVDLVLKANLGVVSVDRGTIRIPIDSGDPPTLTALGASLNAGALVGRGYLELENGGFAGSLDVALAPPLGVRVAAGLTLQDARDAQGNPVATAVLVTLGLELPVPIPLANSGLGLFGFLGLFGMHYVRDQPPPETALDWFVDRAQGDATRIQAWHPLANEWAFGLVAVLGTLEGGFLVHTKGMIVVELPGPRLVLAMSADILGPRPGTRGRDTGRFLAIIEITPASLTIGLVVEYAIRPLLELRLPVEAFFDFKQAQNWHLDIGGIPPGKRPVSVTFLFSLRAEGYLLLRGNGIPEFPLHALTGFAVAAGLRAALIWGPEDIGLYLKVAAEADLGISFKPFLIIGRLELRGELHLFIVGIEVSASAEVQITDDTFFIHAEVCGKVDFFFFDVEGCVTLELGSKPERLPAAPPLLRAVSLHSRSPALVPGTGTDRAIDGSLADAVGECAGGTPPVVPIDAIPVLQFELRPYVDPACKPLGQAIESKLPAGGWVRRGERFYRYTLKAVDLSVAGVDANGAPLTSPVDAGDTPCRWWDRTGSFGTDDGPVQLALLTWIPDPTPAAAERTVSLDQRITRRWGGLCDPVAPPTAVLWSFRPARLGPSPDGWVLPGTAWPDPPGSRRSLPPDVTLRVSEPWRSGNRLADGLTAVEPAIVFRVPVVVDRVLVAPRTGRRVLPAVPGDDRLQALVDALRPGPLNALADALRLVTGSTRLRGLMYLDRDVWREELMLLRSLDDAGNDTGLELPITPGTTRPISVAGELPPEWTDPAGPWAATVGAVLTAWGQVYIAVLREPQLVLVEADLPAGTTAVEIGVRDEVRRPDRCWGILLVESVSAAEVARWRYDEEARRASIQVINGALGADDAKRALLHPNATYTVDVTYDVAVADADEHGNPKPSGDVHDQHQRFVFKTDAAPPARLDPWVLATDPAPAQAFFFWGDPIRVVFATGAVRKLYAAYGRKLFAVVRAASGRPVAPAPGFDPGRVALEATVRAAAAVPAVATTPWASAVRAAVADLPCLDVTGVSSPHEVTTLTLQLEPTTEYLLDIEAEPPTGDAAYPLLRRHFSTSGYASARALADAVAAAATAASIGHRWLADLSVLTHLGTLGPDLAVQVRDLELEGALRAARWGELARPEQPRVTVIWQGGTDGNPPQPSAVLIETPEPLWRSRGAPREVTDPAGTRRFELRPEPWLEVVETSAAGPLVERFVHSGGGRTLVLLKPNARGGRLDLALQRRHHPLFEGNSDVEAAPLMSADLATAPWEG